jgi:hypothetical protein
VAVHTHQLNHGLSLDGGKEPLRGGWGGVGGGAARGGGGGSVCWIVMCLWRWGVQQAIHTHQLNHGLSLGSQEPLRGEGGGEGGGGGAGGGREGEGGCVLRVRSSHIRLLEEVMCVGTVHAARR